MLNPCTQVYMHNHIYSFTLTDLHIQCKIASEYNEETVLVEPNVVSCPGLRFREKIRPAKFLGDSKIVPNADRQLPALVRRTKVQPSLAVNGRHVFNRKFLHVCHGRVVGVGRSRRSDRVGFVDGILNNLFSVNICLDKIERGLVAGVRTRALAGEKVLGALVLATAQHANNLRAMRERRVGEFLPQRAFNL